MITALALSSLLVWLAAGACLFPSFVRSFRGSTHPGDEWRSIVLYAAGLIVAFNARRLIMEANRESLAALYSLSILLAIYVLLLLWRKRGL